MTFTFNLMDQAWIPCVQADGRLALVGIRQALAQAHHMQSLQGDTALETAAIHRLLLAVLHAASRGPHSQAGWRKLWQAGSFDYVWLHKYLDKWQDRFDLFDGQRPFYQAADARVKPKSVVYLAHGMSTANALFAHEMITEDVALTCAQAARTLLVSQAFGLWGLCNPQHGLVFKAAPWTKGVIFLVLGDNLFETLMLNLLRYDGDWPITNLGNDLPAWEADNPFFPNRDKPNGYLDYLTWQSRRISLIPTQAGESLVVRHITISPGLSVHPDVKDPLKQYVKKDKWLQLQFVKGRSLWRDSYALINFRSWTADLPEGNLLWLCRLMGEGAIPGRIYLVAALGMSTHIKNAKINFYRQERLALPHEYLKTENWERLAGALGEAVQAQELVYKSVRIAIFVLAKYLLSPQNDLENGRQADPKDINHLMDHLNFESNFWGALERPYTQLVLSLPQDEARSMEAWRDTLKTTAWQTLEQAAGAAGSASAGLKAAVNARTYLGGALNKIFGQTEPEEETAA